MKREKINKFIEKNWQKLSDKELASECSISINAIRKRRQNLGLERVIQTPELDPQDALERDTKLKKAKDNQKSEQKKVEILSEQLEQREAELEAVKYIKADTDSYKIAPRSKLKGEATMVALLSDWHIEERVRHEETSGLNEFNLNIAKRRIEHLFQTVLHLVEIERQSTKVDTLILALLGDYFSGNIHEELMEVAELEPIKAGAKAQEHLRSGIEHIRDNSDLNIICVCHSGNHGRMTGKQRTATEAGNSLEFYMYHVLAEQFASDKRITFMVPETYYSLLDVYDMKIRFQHGHRLPKYQGGVSGITLPITRGVDKLNKGVKADMDCFGHYHQAHDGGFFIANGSLIGTTPYSLPFGHQPPIQMMFGIHNKLGHYITRRIKFPV